MSVNISSSYLQSNKHADRSDRFKPIQASAVGEAMVNNGLSLVSLSTGKAKHEDKADFQRTLSRYRGPSIGEGVNLDIVYDSKHMGRGVDRILLGIYRMICTNGLFVGTNFFAFNVRHSGSTYENLNQGIAAALDMQATLSDTIQRMQSIQLTSDQREFFAREAIKLLVPNNALQVSHRLLKVRREADQSNDLWTTFNVVQENAVSGKNIAYTLPATNKLGQEDTRSMTVRAIRPNSGKDAAINQGLFEIAEKLAA